MNRKNRNMCAATRMKRVATRGRGERQRRQQEAAVNITIEKKKPESDYWPVRQVADYLGVGRTLIYGLMESGELAYVEIGKTRRIHRDVVAEFIKKHTVGSAA